MRLLPFVLLLSVASFASAIGSGGSYTVDGVNYDFRVTTFATDNIDDPPGALTFDKDGNLYVVSYLTADLRKYSAGSNGVLPANPSRAWRNSLQFFGSGYQRGAGFAFSKAGSLYVALHRYAASPVIMRVNTATGDLIDDLLEAIPVAQRPVISIASMVNDPVSRDIFFASSASVYRLVGTGAGETPALQTYTTFPASAPCGGGITGLSFDPIGTLYFAGCYQIYKAPYQPAGQTAIASLVVSAQSVTATVPTNDSKLVLGLKYAADITAFSLVTKNGFTASRQGSDAVSMAVGPDACLYFSQPASLVKMTNLPNGKCNFALTPTNSPIPVVVPTNPCGSNVVTVSSSCNAVSKTTSGKSLGLAFSSSVSNCS